MKTNFQSAWVYLFIYTLVKTTENALVNAQFGEQRSGENRFLVIQNQNLTKGLAIDTMDPVTIVRTADNTLLRLTATSNDTMGTQRKFNFILDSGMNMFDITSEGYIVANIDKIKETGLSVFTLKVRAENSTSSSNNTQFSDPVLIEVMFTDKATVTDCCNILSESGNTFLAPMIVFIVLFILCIPVIFYLLVYKLRNKELQHTREKQSPYSITQHSLDRRHVDIGRCNASFRDDASSIKSSVTYKRSYESLDITKITSRDDDTPHIAPLDIATAKRITKVIAEEDISSIVPYPSSSSVHDWNTEYLEHSLTFNQIRVENWLRENKRKKCGVGEVALGKPTPCFVKIIKDAHKPFLSDDVYSMDHVLHYTNCDHQNIVRFYGSCLHDGSLYLVSEFISSRDLRTVLLSSRALEHSAVISTLSGAQLLKFILGIAEGLVYMHGNDVVHGALCARNIRVNDRLVPKIAECCGENSKRYRLRSSRWAAPECFSSRIFSEMADVWTYGVVVWEILSLGGTPFYDVTEVEISTYVKRQLQTGGSLLPVTRNITRRLWLLLQSCWCENPVDRPSISEITAKLKLMKTGSNAVTVARAPAYQFFPAKELRK